MTSAIQICSNCKDRFIFKQNKQHTRLLLVEGKDDWNFFIKFLKELNITNVWIEEYGGKSRLEKTILDFFSRPPEQREFEKIAFMRDADTDGKDTVFKEIIGYLEKAKKNGFDFGIPKALTEFHGCSNLSIKTGIFVCSRPDGQGELEDILYETIPNSIQIKTCVEQYIQCLKKQNVLEKEGKVRLHTWLAGHDNGNNLRFAEVLRERNFNLEHPALSELTTFIKKLSEI